MSQTLESAGERFSRDQVRRVLRLSDRQLAAWERQGFVEPMRPEPASASSVCEAGALAEGVVDASKTPPSKSSFYTFSDLITLKTLLQLRKDGVPPARLRQAHLALKKKLAEVEKPWAELQVRGKGRRLTVQFQGNTMEAITGQLLLDYAGPAERREQARVQPFHRGLGSKKRTPAEKKAIAERFFMAGLRYEEDGAPAKKAIAAYQRAIELNPQAVGAFINLGTIYYNLGHLDAAESCYQAALSIDPGYGLIHFNLGNVADEKNQLEKARQHYEDAVRRDPSYPDPHYNLALVYEKLGLHGKARQQWLAYLKLDRQSQWAAYAKQQVDRTPLKIVREHPATTPSDEHTIQPPDPSEKTS